MVLRRALYEGWQMECCGRPFSVGDEVTWPVMPMEPDDMRAWGWDEEEYEGLLRVEYHSDGWPTAEGRVRAIHLVQQEYAETGPGSRTFAPVPGRRTLEPVDSCPKWFARGEPADGPDPRRRRDTDGVLVTLDVPDPPETVHGTGHRRLPSITDSTPTTPNPPAAPRRRPGDRRRARRGR
ncbi:DUF6578 domain-containing protein [Streptomyces sp. NPDC001480]|uniref:DUF6578 domain-containing protein n=1 Tax=Streptomyces sp. NPDC001480 TaxID=3364577 RepID=UPI0036C2BBF5